MHDFTPLGEGNTTAGSKYQNSNFRSETAAKRRALTGCMFGAVRSKAGGISEKECSQRVLMNDCGTILGSLKDAECVSCAYGILDK